MHGCADQANTLPSVLRLATTTSTRDSGLLDVLLPPFAEEHNVRIDVVAVGSGKALKLGAAGDADLVLVHARTAEDEFGVKTSCTTIFKYWAHRTILPELPALNRTSP